MGLSEVDLVSYTHHADVSSQRTREILYVLEIKGELNIFTLTDVLQSRPKRNVIARLTDEYWTHNKTMEYTQWLEMMAGWILWTNSVCTCMIM